MSKKEFFKGKAHGRVVTVCALRKVDSVHVGIAIQHPIDDPSEDIAEKISEGRARSSAESYRNRIGKTKINEAIDGRKISKILLNDKFFLEQIARSYFYDVRHNPDKYIAGL